MPSIESKGNSLQTFFWGYPTKILFVENDSCGAENTVSKKISLFLIVACFLNKIITTSLCISQFYQCPPPLGNSGAIVQVLCPSDREFAVLSCPGGGTFEHPGATPW